MLTKVIGGLLCVCVFVAAAVNAHTTNPREEAIVGVWQSMGIDTPIRTVFRRDRTVVELFPEENSESGWLQFQVGNMAIGRENDNRRNARYANWPRRGVIGWWAQGNVVTRNPSGQARASRGSAGPVAR
jgi:hypothetical protein